MAQTSAGAAFSKASTTDSGGTGSGSNLAAASLRADLLKESELREQSREFLKNFIDAAQAGTEDLDAPSWKPAKEVLSSISRSRATQGFSPSETAMFVFSLKQPLFEVLKRESLPAQELD